MSRAGDPTAVTWTLLGLAVAYSAALVARGLPIDLALLPMCAVAAVGALLRTREQGCAVGVALLTLGYAGLLLPVYLVGLHILPVVVLLATAILAPRRRWDSA